MKFSHSLQFNAVPEWSSKYIAYSTLKKLIYQLQRENASAYAFGTDYSSEQQPLTLNSPHDSSGPVPVFEKALDKELAKVEAFYRSKEAEVYAEFDTLVGSVDEFEKHFEGDGGALEIHGRKLVRDILDRVKSRSTQVTDTAEVIAAPATVAPDSEIEAVLSNDAFSSSQPNGNGNTLSPRQRLSSKQSFTLFDDEDFDLDFISQFSISIKKRLTDTFVRLSELKSYVELNRIGFAKALKKFDKSLLASAKDSYLERLDTTSYTFSAATMRVLDGKIHCILELYALGKDGDLAYAKAELKSHLRDHIVWERNTVWRDMLGMERKSQAAHTGKVAEDTVEEELQAPVTAILLSNKAYKLYAIILITTILLNVHIFADNQQKNCFALLVCSSLLWATEAIPLFTTSLAVPLLIVLLRVLKDPATGRPLDAPEASKFIFGTMWSSIIMLLLGGFTLAAALSKYHVDRLASTWILSRAGTNPRVVLLVIMGVSLFASMWVSNVAAPVLMYSIIQPVLRTTPKDSDFGRALIIGIALAANVGGMGSPIASPQNIVAIEGMDPPPSWGQWFVIALPVCAFALVAIWLFLLLTFDIGSFHLVPIRTIDARFTRVQWYVTGVSMGTIVLWCLSSRLDMVFGEMGIIAIIPMVAFYGTGLLGAEDINNYPWNIVLLAMGGIALGKAVTSSHLLATIALEIQAHVGGLSLWSIILVFGILVLTMATFVSHTVAALIVVPLVAEIGASLPDPHPRIIVMATALLCSSAMGLPTSGFPNVTAICMLDDVGKPYLTVNTFITRGVPSSFVCYFIIVTLGYFIMRVIDF
ncbi:unnamed protein product [Kuraishia capsulata CBS 1993]|uniref:SPX domain-containing protein n=1 Tax=Kuraishia capsulata CBS 1993 TaxID=1382522 RepID=W6MK15_9ASCO|nr:uncharacterized protein KUCA_T00002619001 [Kuraishia capsulata CBS 1993]CDK26646.1 unnamed protein product [Kuraishia capsulata CBS 1993]